METVIQVDIFYAAIIKSIFGVFVYRYTVDFPSR